MDARTKRKYKRILTHLKVCIQARNHGRWYWENGEVIRFQVDFGQPLTQKQLEERIQRQRQMLAKLSLP